MMLRRAKAFIPIHAKEPWNTEFKITGFRLVRERVEVDEVTSFPAD
jgi:hypothetical protein